MCDFDQNWTKIVCSVRFWSKFECWNKCGKYFIFWLKFFYIIQCQNLSSNHTLLRSHMQIIFTYNSNLSSIFFTSFPNYFVFIFTSVLLSLIESFSSLTFSISTKNNSNLFKFFFIISRIHTLRDSSNSNGRQAKQTCSYQKIGITAWYLVDRNNVVVVVYYHYYY